MKLSRPARQDSHRGWIPGKDGHRGMDFGWGNGDGIYAAAPGVVETVYDGNGWNSGWGNRIAIRHTPRAVTTYSHERPDGIFVSPGQSVVDQQNIGLMGETGDTDGKHLHFELYIDGERVDPAPYFYTDLPGTDGSGVGVPAPSGWSVGETDFTGAYGLNELAGARWYVIEPATDNSKTIAAICEQYGVSLAAAAAWTAAVAASKWGVQLLQGGSSWWDGTGTYYAGVCVALNDVVAALAATEAAALETQRAAVAAAQVPAPQPAVDGSSATNREGDVSMAKPAAKAEADEPVFTKLPDTGDLADLTNTAARNVGNVLPDWARRYILWPLILVLGTALLTTIGVFVGLNQLPPAWVYGAGGGLIVLLPIVALIALANPTKQDKK